MDQIYPLLAILNNLVSNAIEAIREEVTCFNVRRPILRISVRQRRTDQTRPQPDL